MERFKIKNITHNLMNNSEIDGCFKETIQKLVEQYWPRRSVIFRYICNVANGSKIVDENKNFYIFHQNTELCRQLMDRVQSTTLITTTKRWKHTITRAPMIEVKIYK